MNKYPDRNQYINHNDQKIPVSPQGLPIDPHDPNNWMSFDDAQRQAKGLGIGFVLTAHDPYFVIDIDGCRDPVTGQYDALAMEWKNRLNGCAVEVSRSGEGIHFWGTCEQNIGDEYMNRAEGIEFYQKERYIALGSLMQGDVTFNATEALKTYLKPRKVDKMQPLQSGPVPEWDGPTDDTQLVQAAIQARGSIAKLFGDKASFAELWNGDASALCKFYPSKTGDVFDRSCAESALLSHLAFWTGKDSDRMARIFLQSPLALSRPDQKKLHRADYIPRTVAGSASACTSVYCRPKSAGESEVVRLGTDEAPAPINAAEITTGAYLSAHQQKEHFKGCVYVADEHRVLLPDGRLLKPDQFKVIYGGHEFEMQADGSRPTRDAWECFTQSRSVRFPRVSGSEFMPEKPFGHIENGKINTFVPTVHSGKRGDVGPFLDLLQRLMPNENDREIFLSWCAAMVQYPGKKFQWCVVVQGTEGNGKTFLLTALSHAVGLNYSHLPNPEDMDEKYNTYLERNLLVGVEEVYMSGRRDMLDRLKKYITNTRIEIRSMGTDKRMSTNLTNWMFLTNYKEAVVKTRNDRRYAVIFTAQQSVDDIERDGLGGSYFPDLWDWARGDGFDYITTWLSEYQISEKYNPATTCHRAPRTSSHDEAIAESLGRIEQEIQEAVEQELQGFRGGWVSSLCLRAYLDDRRINISNHAISNALEALGYVKCGAYRNGRAPMMMQEGGKRPVLYCKPSMNASSFNAQHYMEAQGYSPPGATLTGV